MSANLALNLTRTAAEHPDAIAVSLDDAAFDYGLLEQASARVCALLRSKGVGPAERVAIMLPNVPYFPAVYYGVLRAGAIVVPMNVLLKTREVGFYLSDPEVRLLFAWHDFLDAAEQGAKDAGGVEVVPVKPGEIEKLIFAHEPDDRVAQRVGDDTAVILYTSGTTGSPRGAELTHDNLRSNASAAVELFGLGEGDVIFGGLPLFHSFGQTCTMNAAVCSGAAVTLLPRFDAAKALEILERDGCTVFEGVPTMYGALLHHPDRDKHDCSSLRVCVSGGASLPVDVLRGFEGTFGCKVLEGYGLSETSPIASFNHPDRDRRPGSIGTPLAGVQMRLVDDRGEEVPAGAIGEIVIRGHNVMKGYWNDPEATAKAISDGWLRTGDLAKVDEDGYYYIVDRKKDLIIRGGYNVYPREVEEVLYEHPAVREAAVVGITHDELGEEVGAAVALRDGASVDPEELGAYVKERVAAYKYPRRIWLVDELPKGPTGKILKREIHPPGQRSPASP